MTSSSNPGSRRQIVAQLARSIRQVQTAAQFDRQRDDALGNLKAIPLEAGGVLSCESLLSLRGREDRSFHKVLPEGRLPRGGLLELLAEGVGSGAMWLALHLAAEAREGTGGIAQGIVLIDSEHELYPPALSGTGVRLAQTIVVRPRTLAEGTWAFEQALRCPGVAAAWCRNQKWNDRVFRRLQLAAEAGGGVGLISSPAEVRRQPSWAEVRWLVRSVAGGDAAFRSKLTSERREVRCERHEWARSSGRRLQIELLQARGGTAGGVVELEICDETGVVRLVPAMGAAATAARAARA